MTETDRDQDVNFGKKTAGRADRAKSKTAGTAKTGKTGKTAGKGDAGTAGRKSGRSGGASDLAVRKDSAAAPAEKTEGDKGSADRRAERAGAKGRRNSSAAAAGRTRARAKGRNSNKSTTQTLTKSFRHAFDGILDGLEERNMKIHCTVAALVVFFGLVLHISVTEWCICFVLFGLIMGLELVNTAIEATVDLVTEEFRPLAKRAKDAAAGAVLIASIMAAAAGLIIFIPRLLYVIRSL